MGFMRMGVKSGLRVAEAFNKAKDNARERAA